MGKEFDSAMKAILVNIFEEINLNGPAAKAFKDPSCEIYGIDSFVLYDPEDVKDLTYEDDTVAKKLTKSDQKLLISVMNWGRSEEVLVRLVKY